MPTRQVDWRAVTDVSSNHLVYYDNVRCGNTVVVHTNADGSRKAYFGRRGLRHLQDLDHSNIGLIDESTNPTDTADNKLTSLFSSTREYFRQKSDIRVSIFKTSISDGVSVSVSFDDDSLCWIVGDEFISIGL